MDFTHFRVNAVQITMRVLVVINTTRYSFGQSFSNRIPSFFRSIGSMQTCPNGYVYDPTVGNCLSPTSAPCKGKTLVYVY